MNLRLMTLFSPSRAAVARLTLAVLLATTALQMAELSHQHTNLDSAEQCLLCKTDGQAAVASLEPRKAPAQTLYNLFAGPVRETSRSAVSLPPPRGPPAHS